MCLCVFVFEAYDKALIYQRTASRDMVRHVFCLARASAKETLKCNCI